MERLTKRDKESVAYWNGANGRSYSDNQGNIYGEAITKLAEYEDLEEQGLLIRLPVPEGTKVYQICRTVIYGEVGDKCEFNYFWHCISFNRDMIEEWGKTVFLTKEEVKVALAKMKEGV